MLQLLRDEDEIETNDNDTLSLLDNLPELQRSCDDLGRIIKFLEDGILPQDDKLARKTVYESDLYFIQNAVLYHQYLPREKNIDKLKPVIKQVAVPIVLRNEVLRN